MELVILAVVGLTAFIVGYVTCKSNKRDAYHEIVGSPPRISEAPPPPGNGGIGRRRSGSI